MKEENLEIRYEHRIELIPVDVYRKYLKECWQYYGVDFLSFAFSIRFRLEYCGFHGLPKQNCLTLSGRSCLLLSLGNSIPAASYIVECNSTDESRSVSL